MKKVNKENDNAILTQIDKQEKKPKIKKQLELWIENYYVCF
jgi:hypothetical protein